MAFTRLQMRTKIANFTGRANQPGRADDTKFDDLANDGIDAGFSECLARHLFRDNLDITETIAITSGNYQFSLSSLSFEDIISATITQTSSPEHSYVFEIKSPQEFNRRFPDRARSGSNTVKPYCGALIQGNLEIQAPSDGNYTITLFTDKFPTFASLDESVNPIPLLDQALISYGAFWVFESSGTMVTEADRSLAMFERRFNIARIKDGTKLAERPRLMQRPMAGWDYRPDILDVNYSLADLQSIYP